MISKQYVLDFINSHDYDVRKSHNARWIDQKCTPDVVMIVADCVLHYSYEKNEPFTRTDIWRCQYAEENVHDIFRKPSVHDKNAENEYDKFFSQPLKLLAYAGVLNEQKGTHDGKHTKTNFYTVADVEVLKFIAARELNSLYFVTEYISKVLSDSGLTPDFDAFFDEQTPEAMDALRHSFFSFTQKNTPVNGDLECGRIFTKIINPLAFSRNLRGTERGAISKQAIGYADLMYNRNNFRDLLVNKPKGVTRQEYAQQLPEMPNDGYIKLMSTKSKQYLKEYNDQFRASITEHNDDIEVNGLGVHVHHIFPEAVFPEISAYLENLIVLTPTQHLTHAHPMGKTRVIDQAYQHQLILSKINRIRENLSGNAPGLLNMCEPGYDFSNLLYVLSTGLEDESINDIASGDYDSLIAAVNAHYQAA